MSENIPTYPHRAPVVVRLLGVGVGTLPKALLPEEVLIGVSLVVL